MAGSPFDRHAWVRRGEMEPIYVLQAIYEAPANICKHVSLVGQKASATQDLFMLMMAQ